MTLNKRPIAAADAPASAGGYPQALEATGASRTLFISGQVPVASDGTLAPDFETQAAQVWANVEAQLKAADMSLDNLVKATIFLADRAYALPNRAARQAALGDRQVALTVVIAGIFDAEWLLEIEAIAMA
ncbi:MAG: RidA family protein [Rhodospirillales bacterium]